MTQLVIFIILAVIILIGFFGAMLYFDLRILIKKSITLHSVQIKKEQRNMEILVLSILLLKMLKQVCMHGVGNIM